MSAVSVDVSSAGGERWVVEECCRTMGWKCVDHPTKFASVRGDIVWAGNTPKDFRWMRAPSKCGRQQIVNRIPGLNQFSRKRWLTRILNLHKKYFPEEFDYFPDSWLLPEEQDEFFEACDASCSSSGQENAGASESKEYFLLKPDSGAKGHGLRLFTPDDDREGHFATATKRVVSRDPWWWLQGQELGGGPWGDVGGNCIVQKYISQPLLLPHCGNNKFDLRVYALVTGVNPCLKCYIAHQGLVRFCTEEYEPPSQKNKKNRYIHFTNYAINRRNHQKFRRSSDVHDTGSHKRLLTDVLQEVEDSCGFKRKVIWNQLKRIVRNTLTALQPLLLESYRSALPLKNFEAATDERSRCFQLLGFDILIDKFGKAWLLEINANPSLRTDYESDSFMGFQLVKQSPTDVHIKMPLLKEALSIASRLVIPPAANHRPSKHRRARDSADSVKVLSAESKPPSDALGHFSFVEEESTVGNASKWAIQQRSSSSACRRRRVPRLNRRESARTATASVEDTPNSSGVGSIVSESTTATTSSSITNRDTSDEESAMWMKLEGAFMIKQRRKVASMWLAKASVGTELCKEEPAGGIKLIQQSPRAVGWGNAWSSHHLLTECNRLFEGIVAAEQERRAEVPQRSPSAHTTPCGLTLEGWRKFYAKSGLWAAARRAWLPQKRDGAVEGRIKLRRVGRSDLEYLWSYQFVKSKRQRVRLLSPYHNHNYRAAPWKNGDAPEHSGDDFAWCPTCRGVKCFLSNFLVRESESCGEERRCAAWWFSQARKLRVSEDRLPWDERGKRSLGMWNFWKLLEEVLTVIAVGEDITDADAEGSPSSSVPAAAMGPLQFWPEAAEVVRCSSHRRLAGRMLQIAQRLHP